MTITSTIRLGRLASARSGDKGNHANIGIVAFTEAGYRFLERYLTPVVVAEYFSGLWTCGLDESQSPSVERFSLPNVGAFNFVLHNALGGGASRSLRIDTQGKLLGTAILAIELEWDTNDVESIALIKSLNETEREQ